MATLTREQRRRAKVRASIASSKPVARKLTPAQLLKAARAKLPAKLQHTLRWLYATANCGWNRRGSQALYLRVGHDVVEPRRGNYPYPYSPASRDNVAVFARLQHRGLMPPHIATLDQFKAERMVPRTGAFFAYKKAIIRLDDVLQIPGAPSFSKEQIRDYTSQELTRSLRFGEALVVLEVPARAKRMQANYYKARVSEARVLYIRILRLHVGALAGSDVQRQANGALHVGMSLPQASSSYIRTFQYRVGAVIKEPSFASAYEECASGIHCFTTAEQAEKYGV